MTPDGRLPIWLGDLRAPPAPVFAERARSRIRRWLIAEGAVWQVVMMMTDPELIEAAELVLDHAANRFRGRAAGELDAPHRLGPS